MGKIHFKTDAAACLFSSEITGQLSDGYFENARPSDHWKFWCDADVVVDGGLYTEGKPLKNCYNLRALKRFIKKEMMDSIRFARSRFYKPELMKFKRLLTEDYYRQHMEDTPFIDVPKKEFDPKVTLKYTYQDLVKKILDGAKNYQVSEEFKHQAEAEAARILTADHDSRISKQNAVKKAERDELAAAGITAENFTEVTDEIQKISVSDSDLDTVISEIVQAMMQCR